jgi:hypothetical protein
VAKAGGKNSTEWIRYSRAKKLICDYLEWDAKSAEREILKRIVAAEIRWQCGHFQAPKEYSGPGPGDPRFFKPDDSNRSVTAGGPLVFFHNLPLSIRGDTIKRNCDGAVAEDIEVAYEDLAKLKLLPSASSPPAKKARRLSTVDIVVAEKFPDGVPPNLSPKEALRELGEELKRRKITIPHDDTLKRKLGLKKY